MPPPRAWDDDREQASRIARGEAKALEALIDELHRPLCRIAEAYVGRGAAAEDVLQETWAAVIDHAGEFEGRSTLRTWITRILINQAKNRRQRDNRFVALADEAADSPETRFSLGFFNTRPANASGPEQALLIKEASGWLVAALAELPSVQRAVVTLRDVEEWTSEEVCNALELSESNQRVLLHRARQKLRAALEERVEAKVE